MNILSLKDAADSAVNNYFVINQNWKDNQESVRVWDCVKWKTRDADEGDYLVTGQHYYYKYLEVVLVFASSHLAQQYSGTNPTYGIISLACPIFRFRVVVARIKGNVIYNEFSFGLPLPIGIIGNTDIVEVYWDEIIAVQDYYPVVLSKRFIIERWMSRRTNDTSTNITDEGSLPEVYGADQYEHADTPSKLHDATERVVVFVIAGTYNDVLTSNNIYVSGFISAVALNPF